MDSQFRWIFVEALKLALIVAIFSWFQSRIIDTRYEVYACTNQMQRNIRAHADRLADLEQVGAESGASLAETRTAVYQVRDVLDAKVQNLAEERNTLRSIVENASSEMRGLINSSFERIDGAAFRESQLNARVNDLEQTLRRQPDEMKRRMLYPIVQLRGNGTVGSGVVISSVSNSETGKADTYVLTAQHVIQEITEGQENPRLIEEIKFVDPDTDRMVQAKSPAEILVSQQEIDIALLKIELETPWPYVARLSGSKELGEVKVFDSIYAVGCPLGNKPLPTLGEISSQDKMVAGQNFWMINAPTFFGNSGGGVFLERNGHLVGISSMIYTYGKSQPMVVPHMGLFVPLETVRNWLAEQGLAEACGIKTGTIGSARTEPAAVPKE